MSLDDAAERYRTHVEQLPSAISPRELLSKRPLPLYWGLGLATSRELASALVQDRLTASLEMAMGYLYEIALVDACGARKLSNAEKKKWRGIDFRKEAAGDIYLINLKSARGTANGDISTATMQHLSKGRSLELEELKARMRSGDDNPLISRNANVFAVRAIARGPASEVRRLFDGQEILVLVGDALWERLGGGKGFTWRLQQAVGNHPINRSNFRAAIAAAVQRVENELVLSKTVDGAGAIDWPALLARYPDA